MLVSTGMRVATGSFLDDVRYSLRMLRRSPGLSLVAIVVIGLGIGANTAVYSIAHALADRPLPFRHAARTVMIWQTDRTKGIDHGIVSPADFLDWRERSHTFDEMAAWRTWFYNVGAGDRTEQVWGVRTSANFFDLLGVDTALGRSFLPEEEQSGHEQVCILSNNLWQQGFGGDTAVIGRMLAVDGKPFRIVGVLPAEFNLFGTSRSYDLWMPFVLDRGLVSRDDHSAIVFARRRQGVSLQAAQGDMDAIANQLAAEYPDAEKGSGVRVVDMHDDQISGIRPALTVLMAAVSFVLLIGCANVANLFLTKAMARRSEVAIRLALGSGRWRIVRQWFTESFVIGLCGGAFGVALGSVGTRALRAWLPTSGVDAVPRIESIGVDGAVLFFGLVLSACASCLFGILPALQASNVDVYESLKLKQFAGSVSGRRIRHSLVITEVALSVVLLICAGVMMQSFLSLMSINPGFDPANVLTLQVWLPESRYPTAQSVMAFYDRTLAGLRSLPQVRLASAVNFLPLSGWGDFVNFSIAGHPTKPANEPAAQYRVVDPQYFRTMGIPLLRGRDLDEADGPSALPVAVISETVERRFWGTEDAVGQTITMRFPGAKAPWRPEQPTLTVSVVGIVGDLREWQWNDPHFGELYVSYRQNPSRLMRLAIKSSGDPLRLTSSITHEIDRIGSTQPVMEVKTMDAIVSEALRRRRLMGALLGIFASFALMLSAIGIYGAISYSVAQRTHEIGLRMALGASRQRIIRLVLSEGLRLALAGTVLGALATFGALRVLANAFFGIAGIHLVEVTAVATILGTTAVLAAGVPALRASRLDPAVALREE